MLPSLRCSSIFLGVIAALVACEPNVLIGAKLLRDGDAGGQVGASGSPNAGGSASGGVGAGSGGETAGGDATDGGEAGAPGAGMGGGAGAGGAPGTTEWCATSSWLNEPRMFESTAGGDNVIPAGEYVIKYMSGAQLHDTNIGYEVTGHYTGMNMLDAGIHIYSGESVETGATSLWLEATGLVTGSTVAFVEEKNEGHTWPLTHVESAELWVVLYDDIYTDNEGPGVHYCIVPAP